MKVYKVLCINIVISFNAVLFNFFYCRWFEVCVCWL
nr:MAG TPA: hypothetical protein [Caudoviricetes sp.]